MAADEPARFTDKDALLANVALLYYGEGLTQNEIAQRIAVSRQTVVNMLRECRERGIVEIRVQGEVLAASNQSRALCDRFNLTDAYVARTRGAEMPRHQALPQVGRVAAMALVDIVRKNDVVGVAWGETIRTMANVDVRGHVDGVTVCQLIGSMVTDRVPTSEECAIRIARMFDARCYTLHAPAVLSTAALADALKDEPAIAAQLARLDKLDVAVFSAGGVDSDTHLVSAGIAAPDDMHAAVDAGARGIVCCRYIDENGAALMLPPQDRIIAITPAQLAKAERKLLVAAGAERHAAVRAALRGGLVTHLCVDDALAAALLDQA